ncbi:DNA polymerase III subunit delta' [Frigidibacter sp. MR17.24]|uniref:DNA polymerase III subunit delta' n=1 Tax=Frigidibacter sp. MR17.24 TaxID=3127345 RepID=UPI003012D64B
MRAPRKADLDDPPPEPDRVEGVPHPRETRMLYGQQAAEARFLEAFATGRMHHGWLLTGPQGIGKATLAWRMARFLLATPDPGADDGLFGAPPVPDTLDIPGDHPVTRRVAALSDPGLFLLRRPYDEKTGRLKQVIGVEEVRRLHSFFGLSAVDGGRRVVIIDCADEMNVSAANALLKLLEEPPARAVLILIAHRPAGLLPTIRSRCRELKLAPLGPAEIAAALEDAGVEARPEDAPALAELAGGSVGAAMRLVTGEGLALYGRIIDLLGSMPRLDRGRALQMAEQAAARGAEERFELTLGLLDLALSRLARVGVLGPPGTPAAPGEAEVLMRLSPHPHAARLWAAKAQELGARARAGRAVNLDPAALLMDMVLKVNETAAEIAG